ncbi:hypothetical protein MMC16_000666 [Acarospora aff. strigata]|nr:hypothetical protein [Acarospora aff. strigata]
MGKRKELSQAEVWDDSALLRSWDEALEEYKLYHSIHARGEKVEDVIREAEDGNSVMDDGQTQEEPIDTNGNNGQDQDVLEDGELDDQEQQPTISHADQSHERATTSTSQPREDKQPLDNTANGDTLERSGMPHAIVGGVQDEALKNLMMSWYYAGYYTGLYEGKQQAQQ